jgi:hypothetical protein
LLGKSLDGGGGGHCPRAFEIAARV